MSAVSDLPRPSATVGANSASLVQRRVAKLNPVNWPGVQPAIVLPASASASASTPDPARDEWTPSAAVAVAASSPQDSLSEAEPAVLAEAEEDALPETVPMNPLGCFEPALADETEGEPEIDEEVSALDITKKLHQKYAAAYRLSVSRYKHGE